MQKEDLQKLFKKYHEGTCTEDEKALLEAWYMEYNEHELEIAPKKIKAIGKRIYRELPGNHNLFFHIGLKLAVAAGIAGIIIATTVKFAFPPVAKDQTVANDVIHPGGNTAVLALANGQKIDLRNATNGQVAVQGGIHIYKTAGGQITYRSIPDSTETNSLSNNTITTPKGGQWQVILPDGSKVLLNSASSLTYPTTFKNQKTRFVQLTGEGYFEVSKDKAHPFIVKTIQQSVEVLGTHFNINAYPDESVIKTTLAEGRVKINAVNGRSQKLSPGQQSILNQTGLTVANISIDDELAWTRGSFHFSNKNIGDIMREISRWYDIEVYYDPHISYAGLNGRISRSKSLNQVLSALEATQSVHFKVEGRRITVMK